MKSLKNLADGLRWVVMIMLLVLESVAVVALVKWAAGLIKVSNAILAVADVSADEQQMLKELLHGSVLKEFRYWQIVMLVMSVVVGILAVVYVIISFKVSIAMTKEGNKAIEACILSDRDSKQFRAIAMQVFMLIDSSELSEDEKTDLVTRLYADRTVEVISENMEDDTDEEN